MRLSSEQLVEMFRRMLRIRILEETAIELNRGGEIPGGIHTSIGQEATAVGACMAVGPESYMTGTHRSHGHPIGKGAELGPLMAELMGKVGGVCKGKGGSLHLADFAVGSLGESGVVGAAMPVATGAGLSAKLRGTDHVCLCFFGDAAANTGSFHESINLASVWKLPVIYFCENNQYGVTTPTVETLSVENVADRASAYGIPGVIVDGQDPVAVHEAVSTAAERARAGGGPSLVEAKTYRYREHAEGLPVATPYRSSSELEEWMERDPIPCFRKRLVAQGCLSDEQAKEIETQVRQQIEDSVAFARNSPLPTPEAAFDGLYAEPAQGRPSPGRGSVRSASVGEERPSDPTPSDPTRELIYLAAIGEAQHEEMRRDDTVILIGEDVRSNLWGATGFVGEFAKERALDTPISETAFVGAAVGAAMTGMRPIVDMTMACFLYVAMDQFVSQAAKNRYMFGGQADIPVVYRAAMLYSGSFAAHHSDRPYPMFMNVPGLKIIAPASPYDAKGLLKSAIRDDNPVLCFEDGNVWFSQEHVPESEYLIPLGQADIKRSGSDVTVVAVAGSVRHALAAAEELAGEGISVEVVDPRSLVPLDEQTILESVAKTGRLVVADPAHQTCSAASEIAALAAEKVFDSLRAPIVRVTTPNVQIPFSPVMEKPLYPNKDHIIAATHRVLGTAPRPRNA
jgi:TPP-dependent pyruvate/acetoin dehydrogenase alpha subunit/pyruvate/2-oxoglutarate/acetoin dehydrogenase E1 component